MSRRVLLVSYFYGENCETAGFRWNASVPDLTRDGWAFDVITLARAEVGLTPRAVRGEPQEDVEVYPVGQPEPLLSRAVGSVFRLKYVFRSQDKSPGPVGDRAPVDPATWPVWEPTTFSRTPRARVLAALKAIQDVSLQLSWSRRALKVAAALCRSRTYRCVIVSTPPHYTQWVGARLADRFEIPYVADFQDPLFYGLGDSSTFTNDFSRHFAPRFERYLAKRQAVAVHNTAEAEARIAPLLAGVGSPRRCAIPCGYDPHPAIGYPDPSTFRIVFAGWLHYFMDIRPVFAAAARLCRERGLSPDRLSIELMGTSPDFQGRSFEGLAAWYGVSGHLRMIPRGTRREAMQRMADAAVLLAYDCAHPLAVPTKYYDAVQMRGQPLLIGNTEGAMADAASQLGLGVCAPSDEDGVYELLARTFEAWERGELREPRDSQGVFHRRHQSERFASLLESLP
ncbi:MAG TPA: hypothetical protein VLA09_01715 [Longimicrobiales bacterium]|nr:hypothetical protein [Longimicrobiales bacterium]